MLLVKDAVFWDVMPCSLVDVYRRFGGTCCPGLRDRRVSRRVQISAAYMQ
jgi:hypothetical protein